MASIVKVPQKAFKIKPRALQRVNPAREINDREYRRKQQQTKQTDQRPRAQAGTCRSSSTSKDCPNKKCPNPHIVDGVCEGCGREVDDGSELVAEPTFSQKANGAMEAHGTRVSNDSAGYIPSGGARYRRVAGGGDALAAERGTRAKKIREAKTTMEGLAIRLRTGPQSVVGGVAAYKTACATSFTTGRGMQEVVAACFYLACRQEKPCTVMLIDIADLVEIDVFKLGRVFKKFIRANPGLEDTVNCIVPEELVFSFAVRLEFNRVTLKIAQAAVRIMQRMDRDWIVVGRRPAGICGSALIMAARMYNFRRTPMEVAIIAKTTMATLTNRLEEFRDLQSARMNIDDFMKKDLLEPQHDPPCVYRKSAAYQAKMQKKQTGKRKRSEEDTGEESAATSSGSSSPQPSEVRKDADGFAIPPIPARRSTRASSQTDVADAPASKKRRLKSKTQQAVDEVTDDLDTQLDVIARKYGSPPLTPEGDDDDDSSPPIEPHFGEKQMAGTPALVIDTAWELDEQAIEAEITQSLNDPSTAEHAKAYASASERATAMVLLEHSRAEEARSGRPAIYQDAVRDDAEVGEDEFADDPEVRDCKLGEAEVRIKEQIWLNENKSWLREQQEKQWVAKTAPPKKKRNRGKKARIGEGQEGAASSAGEAAKEAMSKRAVSNRINPNAIKKMLDDTRAERRALQDTAARKQAATPRESPAPNEPAITTASTDSESATPEPSVGENRAASEVPSTTEDDEDDETEETVCNIAKNAYVGQNKSFANPVDSYSHDDTYGEYFNDDYVDYEEDIDPFGNDDQGGDDDYY